MGEETGSPLPSTNSVFAHMGHRAVDGVGWGPKWLAMCARHSLALSNDLWQSSVWKRQAYVRCSTDTGTDDAIDLLSHGAVLSTGRPGSLKT